MITIPIRADEEALRQFERLSENERAEIEALVLEEIHRKSVEAMLRLMDKIGAEAAANGMTPEILQEILNDDDEPSPLRD